MLSLLVLWCRRQVALHTYLFGLALLPGLVPWEGLSRAGAQVRSRIPRPPCRQAPSSGTGPSTLAPASVPERGLRGSAVLVPRLAQDGLEVWQDWGFLEAGTEGNLPSSAQRASTKRLQVPSPAFATKEPPRVIPGAVEPPPCSSPLWGPLLPHLWVNLRVQCFRYAGSLRLHPHNTDGETEAGG